MPPNVRITDVKTDKGKIQERTVLMDNVYPARGVCFTHNNSVDNLLRGLGERLMMVPTADGGFAEPPRPVPGAYSTGVMAQYSKEVLKKMPRYTHPISRDEFVALYDGPKRKRYEAAAKRLVDNELCERDCNIQIFIKDEKVCAWSKIDPAPRLISPRSPEYCLELGRYIKPVEHILYKAVARVWGETTIAKGLNFNQRGELIQQKWESFRNPVAVGLDASRFDQHVSVEALEWEHSIYRGCYVGRKRYLNWLLSKQLLNRGTAFLEGKRLDYEKRGARMSGDMNTALGNCLIMTGLVWSYLQEKALSGKLINDGDDCVVFLESEDLETFMDGLEAWFTGKGFSMKVEKPCYELEQIEFCQCHPVFNGERYTMCRNVHKALFTDTVHVGRTPKEVAPIIKATGECGLAWSKGLPIFPAFYSHMANTIAKKAVILRNSGTYWNSRGCVTGTKYISDAARLSFYKAFDISPSEQIAIERFYYTLRVPKALIDPPQIILNYQPSVQYDHYPLSVHEGLNYLLFKN